MQISGYSMGSKHKIENISAIRSDMLFFKERIYPDAHGHRELEKKSSMREWIVLHLNVRISERQLIMIT